VLHQRKPIYPITSSSVCLLYCCCFVLLSGGAALSPPPRFQVKDVDTIPNASQVGFDLAALSTYVSVLECFIFSSSSSSFYAFIFSFKVFWTRTQYIHLFIDNNARKLGRELYKMMIGSQ
jgi:hypothetical protein